MKKMTRPQTLWAHRGFTLIELVLAMFIMSIIGVTISSFMSSSVKAYLVSVENSRGVDEINYVNNRLSYELKNVNHDGTSYQVAAVDLTVASLETEFVFDNIDGSTITVTYDAGNGLLTLMDSAVSGTAYTIADQVTAFSFNYYVNDGVTDATDGSDIQFVEFQISLMEGEVTYSSRTRVALRDLS